LYYFPSIFQDLFSGGNAEELNIYELNANSTNQWVLGCAAGKTPYLAYHDSTDTDVLSSGLLLGLSCAGVYVFATGYFVITDGNFIGNDLPLKASTVVPGSLTLAVAPGGGTVWEDPADIIGVTSIGGQEQVGPYLDVNGNYIPAINTEATPIGGPTYLLDFTTKWSPKRSVAA
jgi:hypothetical protein